MKKWWRHTETFPNFLLKALNLITIPTVIGMGPPKPKWVHTVGPNSNTT